MQIFLKRAYEDPGPQDGLRVLVDRLWPRGVSKQEAAIDLWLKEIAPSSELRRSFAHDPARWEDFRKGYFAELDGRPDLVEILREKSAAGPLTLVFAARDEERNNAVALKEYLENQGSAGRWGDGRS
ncbi:hypothetical protein DSOUD_0560 [Desulfuromonas soudanensis]|uniref:DUF488 domain-containing protein n=1 Tax=Desulfuromonas soudanensis TaxID=1603606 RepID=A0A0M3QEZ6_9BACT|nr:DUF488 family protein [Desulfuromonas soudanensis]ALC15349.1 hypothetical protein DSOUD_0560 [Desulfuromonas soudanensis]